MERDSSRAKREENPTAAAIKNHPDQKQEEKKEEELARGKSEENQPEENGFSNRQNPTTFIPPLTNERFRILQQELGSFH